MGQMAKLNWDKKTAQDKASHIREVVKPDTHQPKELWPILQLKETVRRIEREEWLTFKTINKQQKKKLSLHRQLKRDFDQYIFKHPSLRNGYYAKKVQSMLDSVCTSVSK